MLIYRPTPGYREGPADAPVSRVTLGWRPPGDDRLLGVMTANVTVE